MVERTSGMSGILGVIVGALIVLGVTWFLTDGFGTQKETVSIELKLPEIR